LGVRCCDISITRNRKKINIIYDTNETRENQPNIIRSPSLLQLNETINNDPNTNKSPSSPRINTTINNDIKHEPNETMKPLTSDSKNSFKAKELGCEEYPFSSNLISSMWSNKDNFKTIEITKDGSYQNDWNYIHSLWQKHSDASLQKKIQHLQDRCHK